MKEYVFVSQNADGSRSVITFEARDEEHAEKIGLAHMGLSRDATGNHTYAQAKEEFFRARSILEDASDYNYDCSKLKEYVFIASVVGKQNEAKRILAEDQEQAIKIGNQHFGMSMDPSLGDFSYVQTAEDYDRSLYRRDHRRMMEAIDLAGQHFGANLDKVKDCDDINSLLATFNVAPGHAIEDIMRKGWEQGMDLDKSLEDGAAELGLSKGSIEALAFAVAHRRGELQNEYERGLRL